MTESKVKKISSKDVREWTLCQIQGNEALCFDLTDATLIFAEKDKKVVLAVLPKNQVAAFEKKCLQGIIQSLGVGSSKFQAKFIGPKESLDLLVPAWKKEGIQVLNQVVREKHFEAYYLAHENKIRLSKDAMKDMTSLPVKEKEEAVVPSSVPMTSVPKSKIKVLIVDDSKTIRDLLTSILSADPQIEIVAKAELPSQVEDLIKKHSPDVITLDIHMPEMDGVTLLKKISPIYRIPTVMISSISKEEGPQVLEALENGAVDYIQKPSLKDLDKAAPQIVDRVKMAAEAKVSQKSTVPVKKSTVRFAGGSVDQNHLIVVGSSTGGTEALKNILVELPENIPPMLIVQHIPAVFSLAFANRLNDLCPFEVKEAQDGDLIKPNRVLIAPGGLQMGVVQKGTELRVRIVDAEPVNRHKPSVDYLFDSVHQLNLSGVLGVILTGMGADGAKGLLKLRNQGARTIGQNQETCVVFGMPREAAKLGAVEYQLPLGDIADKILELCSESVSKKSKAV